MRSPFRVRRDRFPDMERPTRFEHHRFLGDKRTQRVYDLDTFTDEDVIAELMARRDLPLLRPRHPRRGPQPRLPARSGPPRRRRRRVVAAARRGAPLPVGREPPGRAPRPAADAGRHGRGARRRARPRLPERGRAPPPWRRRRCPSWPTAWRRRWAGWRWRWPSAAAATPRAASRLAGLARRPRRGGRLPASQRARHGRVAGRVRHRRRAGPLRGGGRPEVRGVATLGAPADFDDWASHPKRLLEHAREVGIINDPTFPADVDAWTRELREMRAVACAPKVAPRPAPRRSTAATTTSSPCSTPASSSTPTAMPSCGS